MQWSLFSLSWVHTSHSLKHLLVLQQTSRSNSLPYLYCLIFKSQQTNLHPPSPSPRRLTPISQLPLSHPWWLTRCREQCLTSASFKENDIHFAFKQDTVLKFAGSLQKNRTWYPMSLSPSCFFPQLLVPPSRSSPSRTTRGKKKKIKNQYCLTGHILPERKPGWA